MTYILQIKIAAVYFRSATSGQAYQFTLEPNIDCAYTNNICSRIIFFLRYYQRYLGSCKPPES